VIMNILDKSYNNFGIITRRTTMTKDKIKKELGKYSKEDIIECLCEFAIYFNSYPLNTMFNRLKSQKFLNKLETQQKEYDKASEDFDDALKKFNEWKEKVAEKYGKDGQVRFMDIPLEEIQIGAKLEEEFNEKRSIYFDILDKEIKQ